MLWAHLSLQAVASFLKVLQWNCRSVRSKKDDLNILIEEHSPDIIALSETWLLPDTTFTLKGYTIARRDRTDGYGGVLLACLNSIPVTKVDITSIYECVVCSINISNLQKLTVASMYCAPPTRSSVTRSGLDHLLNQIPDPKLLLGDFNAQGQQWGNPDNDPRASLLMSVFDDHHLGTLNTGEYTRVACPPIRCSALDLSICSESIALDCTWTVLDSTHGSDHLPIMVTYRLSTRPTAIPFQRATRAESNVNQQRRPACNC